MTIVKKYGTLAVHLPAALISQVEAQAQAEDRSKSYILGRIIRRELTAAPEPSIQFARRTRRAKA